MGILNTSLCLFNNRREPKFEIAEIRVDEVLKSIFPFGSLICPIKGLFILKEALLFGRSEIKLILTYVSTSTINLKYIGTN